MNRRCVLGLLNIVFFVNNAIPLPSEGNKLIYILVDGFRYDYVDDQPAESIPGFSQFLKHGIRAEYMSPIFPSISYPDWTTLVTGLWAESHGIVGNRFYNAEEQDVFALANGDKTGKKKWWTAEPIWTTATKANKRTAVFYWSRCDVPFDGITPEHCEEFSVTKRGVYLFRLNMEKTLAKLQQGFDFILIYTDHTDSIGHVYGPETLERKEAVRNIDSSINYLLNGLEEMGLTDQVNIIMVSDHGMVTTAPETVNRVEMDDYLLTEYVEKVAEAGAYSNIKVKDGYLDQVYEKLKTMPGVNVYLHSEIPENLHYKNHKYIHDIVLVANIDTFIMKSRTNVQVSPRDDTFVYRGAHGYDPREEKMRTIFFATGPDFKSGSYKIPPIQNVDVYPLLAHLLRVQPLPNNGTLETIKMALRSEDGINGSKGVSVHIGVFMPIVLSLYLACM